MADPDSSQPIQVSDANAEIDKLRSEISQVRSEMQSMRAAVAQEVLSRIRLQGGGNVSVSGSNGNFTITGNTPTLNVQATAQCVDGEIVINWTANSA